MTVCILESTSYSKGSFIVQASKRKHDICAHCWLNRLLTHTVQANVMIRGPAAVT